MNIIRKYQKAILGVVLVGLFIGYFVLNRSDFTALSDVNLGYLLLVGLGYVAIVITNGFMMKLLAEPFNVRLGIYESTRVSLLGSLGNFFASSGAGAGVRALYLKKNHDLAYKDYLSTLYGNYLLIFIVNAVAGLLSLLLTGGKGGVLYWLAAAFFCVLLATASVLCFVPLKLKTGPGILGKVGKMLNSMTQGWQLVARNRSVFKGLMAVAIGQLVITIGIIYLQVLALGLSVSFAGLIFLAVLAALSVFVSLTPANVGIKEAVYLLSASIVGLSSGDILSIAIIDRGALFATLGILWIFMRRRKSDKEKRAR
jgi:uncharacterized membrane protein YbhN (UPF0104 family)